MTIQHPYLLFLGDVEDDLAAKTSAGIAQWRPEWCLGQFRLPGCQTTLNLPDMTVEDAAAKGAKTLIIGVANRGGVISNDWVDTMIAAMAAGMDVAAGLHQRLAGVDVLAEAAERFGRRLFDVRHATKPLDVGTGLPRTGKRVLTVGTDCSVGKMYTALALEKELAARDVPCDFRATGQTGIFIAGDGISVDAVIADFISGAVEDLCPPAADDHWDLIEGQGSLFHPSFAGVSMGLLHGAQADWLVMCHEPTRTHMRGLKHYPLPDMRACLEANLSAARLTSPQVRVAGFAINTAKQDPADAARLKADLTEAFGLPAVDPLKDGVAALVDLMLAG